MTLKCSDKRPVPCIGIFIKIDYSLTDLKFSISCQYLISLLSFFAENNYEQLQFDKSKLA